MGATSPHSGSRLRTTIPADIFVRLTRYTRMVLFGKWALAGVSIFIILLIIIIPLVEQTRDGKRISFVSTQQVAGEHPVMLRPKLEGLTGDNEPYTATASRAVQQSENVVQLFEVQADLFKKDNSWLNLIAQEGSYDSGKGRLELWGNVTLYKDDGYTFTTERVVVDTRRSVISGEGAINGQGTLGNLTATGYSIEDNGRRMHFGNNGAERVHVIIKKANE